MHNKKLMLDKMKNMSIEEIVELYKNGYRLDESFSNASQHDDLNTVNIMKKTMINIDRYKCCYCGACVGVCPNNAIELVETWLNINDDCTNCDICTKICSVGALEMTK